VENHKFNVLGTDTRFTIVYHEVVGGHGVNSAFNIQKEIIKFWYTEPPVDVVMFNTDTNITHAQGDARIKGMQKADLHNMSKSAAVRLTESDPHLPRKLQRGA
jgi:hypothetical protein